MKILDKMNIKLLPKHYVLKRWTREARYGTRQDNKGRRIIENPKLDAMLRYKTMSHKFLNLAYQAASFPECCILVDRALDCLGKQIVEKSVHLEVFWVIYIWSNSKFNKMKIC